MEKIDLTIVVPIYNVEKYLEECLESIYKLSIKKEVILVNDESQDNSYLIIEKFKSLYPQITVVITQKNKGLSGARNSGLEIARGKYIAFIDSDDYINTENYECFFKENKDKKLDIIMGNFIRKKNEVETICNKNRFKIDNIVEGKYFFETMILYNNFYVEVWDDIYRKDFLVENKLKFKEGLLHEDILFSVEVFEKAKRVKYINSEIYTYREREGSITKNMTLKNSYHKLYIAKNFLKNTDIQRLNNLELLIINILWSEFRLNSLIEKEIFIHLIKRIKKISKIKSILKLMVIFISYPFSKKIKVESIK